MNDPHAAPAGQLAPPGWSSQPPARTPSSARLTARARGSLALLATLVSGGAEATDKALWQLWTSLHHQGGTTAAGALAVPLLLRIAVAGRPELRADSLRLIDEIGRCQYMGDGSREGLLQVAEEPLMVEGSTMCPVD
ncbi:hypothetical protein STRCI_008571 [Streptomyces cinnabarinus]|uniref:Uncharacterized protein n=1 Tax=Streptomyces cinnabarinus TaxID=67287 RepID=A0ABY7KUR1_9ACTN|nr:hypothetical protein [Streptomyces cinnabarinus]WAZ27365.1 hypothetical protein STRCI_008571 [Streptomyces cinnabarinus]